MEGLRYKWVNQAEGCLSFLRNTPWTQRLRYRIRLEGCGTGSKRGRFHNAVSWDQMTNFTMQYCEMGKRRDKSQSSIMIWCGKFHNSVSWNKRDGFHKAVSWNQMKNFAIGLWGLGSRSTLLKNKMWFFRSECLLVVFQG